MLEWFRNLETSLQVLVFVVTLLVVLFILRCIVKFFSSVRRGTSFTDACISVLDFSDVGESIDAIGDTDWGGDGD